MVHKERRVRRFREAGKVSVPDICIFPGLLIDISTSGCCIRFPVIVEPDTDSDYEASFTLASKSLSQSFVLILQPKWKRNIASATEIGFEFLHSPGTKNLISYVEKLSRTGSYIDSSV